MSMKFKDDFSEESQLLNEAKNREISRRMVEIYLWALVSIAALSRFLIDVLTRQENFIEVIYARSFDLFLSFCIILFPLIFRQVFGRFPLESLRRLRAQRQRENADSSGNPHQAITADNAEIIILSDSLSAETLASSSAIKLFSYYSSTSRKLSQNIYSRAGIYLLTGVLVAFSGLVFFYIQTADRGFQDTSLTERIAEMAPRFGILIFIELIAFFFLRQYRSAMDEFRYFEAIKRCREETLALMRIAEDAGLLINPIEWINSGSFFSKAGVIQKEQSSEIIESRKLEKNELDLLEKILDTLSRGKK